MCIDVLLGFAGLARSSAVPELCPGDDALFVGITVGSSPSVP
jgi:hypothetical protein